MLSDGLFRGAHIFKGCSRHSSLKEWLSPSSTYDIRSIRREVENFPNDISEQPKKVGDFVEVKSTDLEYNYVRKVRCYLVSTHFIIAREKIWKPKEDMRRYEVDHILKLTDHTFYFSGEVLVVETRYNQAPNVCRYFELCDDSSVNIWKLLFRQLGCLGPDTSDDENSKEEQRSSFLMSDDGQFEDLPSALSPPAFFIYPTSKSTTVNNTLFDDINNTLDRSGQTDLKLSKHLCCSENCLLDISHSSSDSRRMDGKRRRISSCSMVRFNVTQDKPSIAKDPLDKKKCKNVVLKSVNLSLSRKFKNSGLNTLPCRLRLPKDDMIVCPTKSYPLSSASYPNIDNFQENLQICVYNMKPDHFAQQLTYHDQKFLLAMTPRELLSCENIADEKCNENDNAPNIRAAVQFFNRISMLVVQLILQEYTPRSRARLIRYFITVADKLRHQHNFSSLRAIIAGLQSNPIYRLAKTWKLIKGQALKTFNNLVEIWKHNNNYENYQTLLEKGLQRGFFIPFLGLFFNQCIMTSLILNELKINEIDLYPEELEGPFDESFAKPFRLDKDGESSSEGASNEHLLHDHDVDNEDVLSIDIALDSICLSPCFPATPSTFTRKLKRLKKKPLHAGEVGCLPKVEGILGPITRAISVEHPKTKLLKLQYLPPYLLRRYQLAASLQLLNDRPAVNHFIFKDKLLSEEELRSLSSQRED